MQKKKPSDNFQKRRQTPKRKKIDPNTVVNMVYNGVRISLLGQADLGAWNAMSRPERRKYIKNVQDKINDRVFKELEVTYENNGMEITKMIYVPTGYKGNGYELLDLGNEEISTKG
jgi:hypothetical protein